MGKINSRPVRIHPDLQKLRRQIAEKNDIRLMDVDKELVRIGKKLNGKTRREIRF